MAREYPRLHDFYLELQDLQPPVQHYHPYEHAHAASSYEVTTGAGAGGGMCSETGDTIHDPRKTTPPHYSSDSFDLSSCDTSMRMSSGGLQPGNATRKRKPSSFSEAYELSGCEASLMTPSSSLYYPDVIPHKQKSTYGASSTYDDEGIEDARSMRTVPDKKQNHSEIEKRRRDKMNTYITELSAMVPMCGAMARKLDKLTVLRMAVQHLRTVRGASSALLTVRPRPAYLSERELNSLVLQAAHDCFLLVVGCDRGRLLYVSASVKRMLHYEQSELLGQSLFDILHPKDVAKVKEQLSASDLSPRERLIDAKTMLPVKADVVAGASQLCPGARRAFFCRIKTRAPLSNASSPATTPAPPLVKDDPDTKIRKKQSSEKKYCVVQCTGYLKSWTPVEMCEGGGTGEGVDDGDASNLSCLVAVVRTLPDLASTTTASGASATASAHTPRQFMPETALPRTRLLQYVSRHATDGKFLFVDQRVTLALGFLPQELLGTSLYEYVGGGELGTVARAHKEALFRRTALHTPIYSFRRKDGTYAHIQTHFKPFRNPWTKDVEYLIANNTIVDKNSSAAESESQESCFMLRHKADGEMQRMIDSQVESHKIGRTIAEEALRRSSSEFSPDLPVDLLHDVMFNQQQASLVDNIFFGDQPYQVWNNVPLSAAGALSPSTATVATQGSEIPSTPPTSPPLPTLGLDANGEAAMAVIMSLLEEDAGLDDPVKFSGYPWPLP